jgi:hypothetical protein
MVHSDLLTNETLENAFIVGLLLTGSIERTETAVLESVRFSCPDDLFGETLFRRVLYGSLEMGAETSGSSRWNELNRAMSILPFELRCVLALPQDLRHCFVMRILVGLPREVCAWLLHIDIPEINQRTQSAMLELSGMQTLELTVPQPAARRVIPFPRQAASQIPRRFYV